jgi:Protein of unknown function (DUF4012)
LAALAFGWVGLTAYSIGVASHAVNADLHSLNALTADTATSLDQTHLGAVEDELRTLRADVAQLDKALRSSGADAVVPALPWLGRHYIAVRGALDIAQRLGQAAETFVVVAREVAPHTDASVTPPWLVAIVENHAALQQAMFDIQAAQRLRAALDETAVPSQFQPLVTTVDRVLNAPEVTALTELDLAAVTEALGSDRPVRYLVLLQNPAELRPGGGFPGSAVLVTLERGAVSDYDFFDMHQLTEAYLARRSRPLPEPWSLAQFLPQDGFLLHDAIWWPDFGRGAAQMLDMYAESGWPPVEGVVAVQPSVVGQLVGLVGPFTVELSDGPREITPDNVYSEIERERQWFTDGPPSLAPHKQALALIGSELIDRLRAPGALSLPAALDMLTDACQRRDVQAYAQDPRIQGLLDEQRCSGRLQHGSQPTLSISFANLVSNKTSQRLNSSFTVSSSAVQDGRRDVSLQIDLQHTGTPAEDPIYNGFQRWLIEVNLPDGSTLLSHPDSLPDPEAPDGGTYLIELWPHGSDHLGFEFSMPDSSALLVRKQAGLSPPKLVLGAADCQPEQATLVADTIVHWDRVCHSTPALESTARASSVHAAVSAGGLFTVQPQHRPRGKIDLPLADQTATGQLIVFGWAAEPTAARGTGVDSIVVYLDGAPLGQAEYGLPRPDIATLFASDAFLDSGFRYTVDLSNVAIGPHTVQVSLRSDRTGVVMNYRQRIRVVAGTDLRGNLDLPRDGEAVPQNRLTIFGWAVDRASTAGAGIERVSITLDGQPVGDAHHGLERADVATILGSDRFGHAGYQYDLDLSTVAAGPHVVEAIAYGVSGDAQLTRTRQIIVEREKGS